MFQETAPRVPSQYRELLLAVDLQGEEIGEVANRLGVTRNNLTVRLHRARKHLKDALAETCQACSDGGCLDCTCEPKATAAEE
jgi:RNA polymerase sigma-70 factor (ECF subfamily)